MLSGSPFSFSKSSGEWLWKRWPAALLSTRVERVVLELAALALLVLGQDLGLGRREHAVEAAQHGHGQHDALVLRRAVGTAQQVGDLPDQVREVVVVRHRSVHSIKGGLARSSPAAHPPSAAARPHDRAAQPCSSSWPSPGLLFGWKAGSRHRTPAIRPEQTPTHS